MTTNVDLDDRPPTIGETYFRDCHPTLVEVGVGRVGRTVRFEINGRELQFWYISAKELVEADDPYEQVKHETELMMRVYNHLRNLPLPVESLPTETTE